MINSTKVDTEFLNDGLKIVKQNVVKGRLQKKVIIITFGGGGSATPIYNFFLV